MLAADSAPRLIALDLPLDEQFPDAVRRVWREGNVVLPLDQRLPVDARRVLAIRLAADELRSPDAIEMLTPDTSSRERLVPLVPDDAVVIATSGSTGEPKGVIHTHHTLRAHATMVGRRLDLDGSEHWWLCLPTAHIGGFGVLHRAQHFEAILSVAGSVTADSLHTARTHGATHTAVVPTHLARHSFADWTAVLVGGAAAHDLPPNAISTYGLTETCGGVVYDGLALSDVGVRIRDSEIQIRTPSLARSYRHGPLETTDGWLATGDLGTWNGERLVIEGRRDDLINTGGNKVWPHVVESRLRTHPAVADVVVGGLRDSEWGSMVCAWIQPQDPSHPPTLEQLRSHVKETLPSYCAPRHIVLIEAIPRSALGKVLRSQLPR